MDHNAAYADFLNSTGGNLNASFLQKVAHLSYLNLRNSNQSWSTVMRKKEAGRSISTVKWSTSKQSQHNASSAHNVMNIR